MGDKVKLLITNIVYFRLFLLRAVNINSFSEIRYVFYAIKILLPYGYDLQPHKFKISYIRASHINQKLCNKDF